MNTLKAAKRTTRSHLLEKNHSNDSRMPWANRKPCKEFSEDEQSPNDPLLVDTRLQTIDLLTDQLTVYAEGSAIGGTRGYEGGVIVMLKRTGTTPSLTVCTYNNSHLMAV